MAGWFSMFSSKQRQTERTGFELYAQAVAAARQPHYFRDLGVPDTLDGRFDLIGLFVALVIHRLRREAEPGPALAQALFDAMFSDMDINLREIGVSDMSVGKRVRAMWEAFHGRAAAYQAAYGNESALTEALARNVWRGEGGGNPLGLARVAERQRAHLDRIPLQDLARGAISFAAVPE